jgi:hypothetical protein
MVKPWGALPQGKISGFRRQPPAQGVARKAPSPLGGRATQKSTLSDRMTEEGLLSG